MPLTQLAVRLSTACSIVAIDVNSANVITGSITLSSVGPPTRERHREVEPDHEEPRLVDDFRDHGFTLPGMIELPGCICGRLISLKPQRGPEASSRRSLQILVSFDDVA